MQVLTDLNSAEVANLSLLCRMLAHNNFELTMRFHDGEWHMRAVTIEDLQNLGIDLRVQGESRSAVFGRMRTLLEPHVSQ